MTAPALRVYEVHVRAYRRVWRGSVISTFFSPVLFLLAMGIGLGQLVDANGGSESLGAVSYLVFLAPGLLAATTMQTGAGDSAWPVMLGVKWAKTYDAALATPVRTDDLVYGHLLWVTTRLLLVAVVFTIVMAFFGAVSMPWGILAIAPAVLTGLAFAAPVLAFTAQLKNETGLTAMFRFGITPLFLFSGTFFPVSQLPDWMEPFAYLTPLWHGVVLTRSIALREPTALAWWVHASYLVGLVIVGTLLARRNLAKRLRS
ncbi:MAG: ABC transporter permease [Acidimicrobiia bacterium]|nr:ABC transporter permease [Acidimicrobiia bacterium]